MFGIGVVGLGFMGAMHVGAWRRAHSAGLPCRLVAVCDRDRDRLSARIGSAGNLESGSGLAFDRDQVHTTDDPDQLLSDDTVDIVSICTPTDTHVDLAIRALAAGKHVLVEKPVAVETARVRELAQASRGASSLVCMPAMCMRFWPAWAWLADRVRDGEFGSVRSASFQRLGARPDWAEFYADDARSGGALVDLHIHDADFVRWVFGAPDSVLSTGDLHHVTTRYRYANGPAHVAAEGGWVQSPGFAFRMHFVVVFEHASAEFELGRKPELLVRRAGESVAVEVPTLNGYDGQVRALLARLSGGGKALPTIDDAVAVAQILDAERTSLHTHAPVTPGAP